jgi:hypothetical protein
MRPLLVILIFALVTSCASTTRLSQQRDALAVSLDQPYYGEASDAAQAAGVDYRALMQRAARNDPIALRRLVRLCADRHFDGAAAFVHCQYIRKLLELWGDAAFSHVISDLSAEERRSLQWAFSDAWYHDFARSFPATSHVVYESRWT